MQRYLFSILSIIAPCWLFSGAPPLQWSQTYGEAPYNQQVTCIALDGSDNFFVGGYVYFGTYGNTLVNKYSSSPAGQLYFNRMYANNYNDALSDQAVSLIPDGQGGVTVFSYINRSHQLLRTNHYDSYGNDLGDYFTGDTSLGNTRPFQVIAAGDTLFYVLAELNGAGTLFMCNGVDSIYWSQPLYNNYNISAGSLAFDAAGNIVAAVFDSNSPEVIVHRFNALSGQSLSVFDTHIDSVAQNDSTISLQIDNNNNYFLAALTSDSAHFQQMVIKFDAIGNRLWSTVCSLPKGYLRNDSPLNLLKDSQGDILANGLYQDYADTNQFAAIYKLDNDSGQFIWTAIDSGNYVQSAALGLDMDDNVYMGTVKAYASESAYSLLWFTVYLATDGSAQWTRSFDNGANNSNINLQVNYAGDLFFTTNEISDSVGLWFVGRIGNAAGDEGVDKVGAEVENMSVFPNPFHATANVSFTLQHSQKVVFRVFDVMGNLLHNEELAGNEGANLISFYTGSATGLYLFQLTDGDGMMCRKAVMY